MCVTLNKTVRLKPNNQIVNGNVIANIRQKQQHRRFLLELGKVSVKMSLISSLGLEDNYSVRVNTTLLSA